MSLDWEQGARPWREVRGPTMRPPSRARTKALLVVVAVGVGFLVGVQARRSGEAGGRLAAESPEDLTRILADLNAETDRLNEELRSLQLKEAQLRTSTNREEVLVADARETLADLTVLAGLTPVRGPGIEITVFDAGSAVTWDLLLDLVQELRDAGAEAISVGAERVVASTWLGPAPGGVVVDGEPVKPPYVLRAIGDADAIGRALDIPGGPLTLLSARAGVRVQVRPAEEIELPALRTPSTFRYARPA